MKHDLGGWCRAGAPARGLALGAGLALALVTSSAMAETRGKRDKAPEPDPMAELAKLKADFEQRLADQEAAAKQREDAIRKESEAALQAARDEANQRAAADRNERQAEVLRLQEALQRAAEREDLRERNAPPSVTTEARGVALYGYAQGDWQLRQSSEDQVNPGGQPLNQDRFLIRRARLGVTMNRQFGEGRIEVDGNTVNGPAFRLFLAEASFKWPAATEVAPPIVMGTVGLFRTPFGHEVPQDDRYRLFMERSTVARALFPGESDLGVRLAGGWHFIRYAIAVQNGQPLGSANFAGLEPNHQKDISGRIGIEHSTPRVEFSGGFSGLRGSGFHVGALATKPNLQWNDSNEDGVVQPSEIKGVTGLAALPSSSFTRLAFGADIGLSLRLSARVATRLAAEFYMANDLDRAILPADPKGALGRDSRELGYYVALVQEVGRWRLGVRYDYYNPDQDSNKILNVTPTPTNVTYSTLAVVAGCAVPWGRILVEYDRNRNHLGLGLTGMPTNLADDSVVVRGEVSF